MKKVLIVSSVASMIEQFLVPSIKLLQEMGFEVHVASNFKVGNTVSDQRLSDFRKELNILDVKIHQVDFSRSLFSIVGHMHALNQLMLIFQENNFSFMHCHSPIGGALGRLAAKKFNVPAIYTAHGFHFFKGSSLLGWLVIFPIELYLSKYTDVLITINNEDFENVRKHKFKAKETLLINGVGIDKNLFQSIDEDEKVYLRNEYGFSREDKILIYVGELSKRKNQIYAIRAIDCVKKYIPNVKLLLVGKGKNYRKYEDTISKLGLDDNISLLGYRKDIPSLMKISDIAISTSKQEGLPVNVLEAMSIGLPLIVTNCRGNIDLVKNGLNGVVVDSWKHDELASKIIQLLNDKSKQELFRNKNLKSIKSFDLDTIIPIYEELYKKWSHDLNSREL